MVTDFGEWIQRVGKVRKELVISPDSKNIPSYNFGKLISDDLTLPPQKVDLETNITEISTNWELNKFPYEPKDIRAIGNAVKEAIFIPFAQTAGHDLAECSIKEFQNFITIAISPEYVEANSDSLTYLSALEKALRDAANEPSGNVLSVTTNDVSTYPLYSWYLVMNLPIDGGEVVPVLIDQAPLSPEEDVVMNSGENVVMES